MISAIDAIERLRQGNLRFVDGKSNIDASQNKVARADLVHGQSPIAIVLACSDSRVPVEMIFDQGMGKLFVIRVAGNIVAPSQIGSIEFAAKQFGIKLVVVLGHSNCGAVIATLEELSLEQTHRSPNLGAIVDRVRPAVESLIEQNRDIDDAATIDEAVTLNVRRSVDLVQQGSLIIEDLIESGELEIVGAEYSIGSGIVDFLDRQ